jgi:basic membrane protein A
MNRFALAAAAVALAALTSLLPGRQGATTAARAGTGAVALRVGLVFDVGGRGDKSFNDAAWAGLEAAQREIPIEVRVYEPTSAEERETALRMLAASGFDLVLAVGFVFTADVDAVAKDYPRVRFACVDYALHEGRPANVEALEFRDEEGSFLVGAAAGLTTRSRVVGFVGGMKSPLLERFEGGFARGVKATCADCTILAAYVGATPEAFRDPVRGKIVAGSQIALRADVLYHASGATGRGVFEAAREGGAFAIGVDRDQYEEAPEVILTSMIKRVDVAVADAVRAAHRHEPVRGVVALGVAEGGVDWVHEGPHARHLPPGVAERVQGLAAGLATPTR